MNSVRAENELEAPSTREAGTQPSGVLLRRQHGVKATEPAPVLGRLGSDPEQFHQMRQIALRRS